MFQLMSISYYDGNTRLSHPNASGNQTFGIGTHEVSSGKWYFEVWIKAEVNNVNIGIGTQGDVNSSGQHYHGYRSENGNISVTMELMMVLVQLILLVMLLGVHMIWMSVQLDGIKMVHYSQPRQELIQQTLIFLLSREQPLKKVL